MWSSKVPLALVLYNLVAYDGPFVAVSILLILSFVSTFEQAVTGLLHIKHRL